MSLAHRVESQATIDLELDPDHWRRHDRAFWAQTLAAAADEAAPQIMRVVSYQMEEERVVLRLTARLSARELLRRWDKDEVFQRLRARLFDLGGSAEFIVDESEE